MVEDATECRSGLARDRCPPIDPIAGKPAPKGLRTIPPSPMNGYSDAEQPTLDVAVETIIRVDPIR